MGPARQVLAVVALGVTLAGGPAPPAMAQPAPGGSGGLAAARAEAARLQREVARLDTEVQVLTEANAAAQGRLDAVIQEAHRQQAALERSELALQATRDAFAGDVRDLYARGPLAPLALLLGARDTHELALAGGVAGRVLERDRQALAVTGLAAGTVRTRVAELAATQAQALALRRRLDGQAAAIGGRWWPPPRCARGGWASGASPTRQRRPHRRPPRSGPRWTRSASRISGARPGPDRSTARGWCAGPTPRPGCRCPAPRGSSSGPAARSSTAASAPATWCSGPPTRSTRRPSTTSASMSARR
jgi:hypothetical protein